MTAKTRGQKPRQNKSKAQLEAEVAHRQEVDRDKQLVKLMWPFLSNLKSIYEAQTVVSGMSGMIKFQAEQKMKEYQVKDLVVDISKEKDEDIKRSFINILGLLENENAVHIADLLRRFGDNFSRLATNRFLKNPVSELTIEDILA